eukprot:EG_transcript_64424
MFRQALHGDGTEEAVTLKGAVFVEVSASDPHLCKEVQCYHLCSREPKMRFPCLRPRVQGQLNQPGSLLKAIVASVAVEHGAAATRQALEAVEGCTVRGVR